MRGIHFADVPPGQAKYVTCVRGAVLDVVVDVRVGSPTFGRWDAVRLDDRERRALYIAEGLGHAFCALEADSTVVYLCNDVYRPGSEHGVHPLDPALGIAWPGDAGAAAAPEGRRGADPGRGAGRRGSCRPTAVCRQRYMESGRGAHGVG